MNQNIGRITCHAVPFKAVLQPWIEVVIISVAVGAVTARRVLCCLTFLSDAHATAENHHSRIFFTDIKGEQILLHQMSIVRRSTAITISAPNARVSEIGIG